MLVSILLCSGSTVYFLPSKSHAIGLRLTMSTASITGDSVSSCVDSRFIFSISTLPVTLVLPAVLVAGATGVFPVTLAPPALSVTLVPPGFPLALAFALAFVLSFEEDEGEDPPLREERRLSIKIWSFSIFGSIMLMSMQTWRHFVISVKAFV